MERILVHGREIWSQALEIWFSGGWAIVRASNTQPVLVLRFEADSEERLRSIRNEVESVLDRFRGG